MLRFFAVFFLLVLAIPAVAHQQKAAIISVEHNPRSGMIEVVHTIPLHDAEHALRQQGKKGADLLGHTESRRDFARYAAERFSIVVGERAIELTLLGTEVNGASVLVYQEGPSPGLGTELTIEAQVLTDIWLRQVNSVNVGRGTSPQTLIFRGGDRAKTAVLR
ncbi:DUF6702 family protein [uncultured Erythrobacter sp.]|uniref:DUF6702 family protein n=1 Tax=uncultured Erythrobacter sp. TaxID=263913 RepID=UPI0026205604|nr:DUF6702 family protein [uncultured Erythrobacter sp.]